MNSSSFLRVTVTGKAPSAPVPNATRTTGSGFVSYLINSFNQTRYGHVRFRGESAQPERCRGGSSARILRFRFENPEAAPRFVSSAGDVRAGRRQRGAARAAIPLAARAETAPNSRLPFSVLLPQGSAERRGASLWPRGNRRCNGRESFVRSGRFPDSRSAQRKKKAKGKMNGYCPSASPNAARVPTASSARG